MYSFSHLNTISIKVLLQLLQLLLAGSVGLVVEVEEEDEEYCGVDE